MHSLIIPPETFNFKNVLKRASWMRRFVRHGEVSKLMKEKEKKQIYVFVHLWGIWVKMPFAHPYSTMKKALYIDVKAKINGFFDVRKNVSYEKAIRRFILRMHEI